MACFCTSDLSTVNNQSKKCLLLIGFSNFLTEKGLQSLQLKISCIFPGGNKPLYSYLAPIFQSGHIMKHGSAISNMLETQKELLTLESPQPRHSKAPHFTSKSKKKASRWAGLHLSRPSMLCIRLIAPLELPDTVR
jgi:hypothetical protein